MDYETAKALYDAQFPFIEKKKRFHLYEQVWRNIPSGDSGPMAVDPMLVPTLEELFDAMPMRIKRHPQLINSGFFTITKLCGTVAAYHAYFEGESGEGVLDGLSFKEVSPKVACAKLWLAINKK